eukprot:3695884-Amphidinium_carterae.1
MMVSTISRTMMSSKVYFLQRTHSDEFSNSCTCKGQAHGVAEGLRRHPQRSTAWAQPAPPGQQGMQGKRILIFCQGLHQSENSQGNANDSGTVRPESYHTSQPGQRPSDHAKCRSHQRHRVGNALS